MSRQGKPRERNTETIKAFWESEAEEWGDSPRVTIRDYFFRNHEIWTLLSLIPISKKLLDVGCGNGFGTLALAKRSEETIGVDFSENMIRSALRAKNDAAYRGRETNILRIAYGIDPDQSHSVDFVVGDILKLDLAIREFDIITGQRILINLPTHADQMTAIENLRKHAWQDTLLFLTEATTQGHARTDQYRRKFGLSPLEKYWHNKYVDEDRYHEWDKHGWRIMQVLFFETYVLLSKVIYPAAVGQENCEFLSAANHAASEIANLFRTRAAAQEIGESEMLHLFVDRVRRYSPAEATLLERWSSKFCHTDGPPLPNWEKIGHQQLIIARAV
jgi:SAM-dependent methyltransferase